MKVWIFNHYAEPPDGRATRSFDLGRRLVEKGHSVRIFASSFSHYTFREERRLPEYDGVRFVWVSTFPYYRNDWRRVANMMSFFHKAVRLGSSLPERPDVVIGVHVHPLAALAAAIVARRRQARFIFEITDLWPRTLIDMGALSRAHPAALGLGALEKFLCRRADRIISVLPRAYDYLETLDIPRTKVVWIPNGVDTTRYEELNDYTGKYTKPFRIYYLGGLVRSNHLDVVLDAAKILGDDVRFVFVGDGTDRPRLVQRARDLELRNVEFHGAFAKRDIGRVMRGADAFIFSLRNLPLYRYGISLNKMCDYLASRRPIVFAGDLPGNPIEEADCGVCVEPENAEALARGIRRLMSLPPHERVRMGRNGFEYLKRYHDMRVLGDRLEAVLRACLGQEPDYNPNP